MNNIIIIDTNIYRQLGVMFYDHIDYKSLDEYCYSSGSEIIITKTVLSEYLDFYKKEIIEKNTLEIEKSLDKLKKLDFFKKIRKPNFSKQSKLQLDFIKNKLTQHRLRPKLDFLLNEGDLIKFLLDNKQEHRKDNTRDYLIWLNALSAAKLYSNNRIILISEDKIFAENIYLFKLKEKHSIKHLELYKSISSFLAVYGFKSEKLTMELILKNIPIDVIKTELLKDKDSIPSHISNFYYSERKKFKLEKFELQDVRVDEFYSHKDVDNEQVKVIAHIQVKVNMIFSPERNRKALQQHLETAKLNDPFKMETFDKELRPVFNDYILFHFSLIFSEETNQITSVEFLDFFPEDYQFRNLRQQLTSELQY
jgi:hypothetical protein